MFFKQSIKLDLSKVPETKWFNMVSSSRGYIKLVHDGEKFKFVLVIAEVIS